MGAGSVNNAPSKKPVHDKQIDFIEFRPIQEASLHPQ